MRQEFTSKAGGPVRHKVLPANHLRPDSYPHQYGATIPIWNRPRSLSSSCELAQARGDGYWLYCVIVRFLLSGLTFSGSEEYHRIYHIDCIAYSIPEL